ncbi:MAG: hypothetical protein QG625_1007 [Cyanobacteriota bacterium erpe_2018_sw_39hr_WHONDRS-SW48-000098_B_bin.30]|nr:hypothetical protein [Cyanobacteriota bacterium erpe_2018_sw_39hr_WHONDRS-SW48-000098_B_bin.30]
MCGIVCVANLDRSSKSSASAITRALIDGALSKIQHRGPDSQKCWLNDNATVALGHARLAIVAVADGEQPIANEDQTLQIIVNGELYDHVRIAAELKQRGHNIATASDAEIAVHLYEEHGLDFVQHLRGEFALALYDKKLDRLVIARDRFGIKPICYTVYDGRLYLASEAKALFAMGIPNAFDEQSVWHTLNMQYTLPDRTVFANIKQLPPGHMLIIEDGSFAIHRYFDLDYPIDNAGPGPTLSPADEQEYIEEFARLFEESVRLRLFSEFPVVCHLSGGLDSASVLAMAAKNTTKPVHCFTVTFDQEGYDELAIASAMAQKAGGTLHQVPVTALDIIEHLSDACYFSEGLAVNGHLSAKHMLNKAIHNEGFRVSLTGEGSDEVLAGYPHLRQDLLSLAGDTNKLRDLHAANPMSKGIMLATGQSLDLQVLQQRLGYIPAFLQAKGTLGYKILSVANADFIEPFRGNDAYGDLLDGFDIAGQLKGRHPVNQSLYIWSKTALANYILRTLGDGVEMGQSLEGRLPFLDHILFEFLRKLPLSLKINGAIEKYILKEALKPYLTTTIYERHKHPFVAPPVSRFADNKVASLVRAKLSSKAFGDLPFYDQNKVLSLFDKLESMPDDERSAVDPVFMTALSYLALKERFAL